MTDTQKLAERVEAQRKLDLIEGCKKIDAGLGGAVQQAFDAGYSAEQVHRMLSGSLAMNEHPAAPRARGG